MALYVLTLILFHVLTMLCPILISILFSLPYFASQEAIDLFMHHPFFLFLFLGTKG
jgi:hypothetical protein